MFFIINFCLYFYPLGRFVSSHINNCVDIIDERSIFCESTALSVIFVMVFVLFGNETKIAFVSILTEF